MNDPAKTDVVVVIERVEALTTEWLRLHEALGKAQETLQASPEYQLVHLLQIQGEQAWRRLKGEESVLKILKNKAKREEPNEH